MSGEAAYIVMTPYVDESMKIINAARTDTYDQNLVYYKATGPHSGIIVNKTQPITAHHANKASATCLECSCLMTNSRTGEVYGENRILHFWCSPGLEKAQCFSNARYFYNELFEKSDLPKDYTGFVKKMLKLMQEIRYEPIVRVDLHLIRLDKDKLDLHHFERTDENRGGVRQLTDVQIRELLQERLEGAYPYHLAEEDLISYLNVNDPASIKVQLDALAKDDVIQLVELGGKKSKQVGYRRKIHLKNQKVCELSSKQAESELHSEKPTIAIITNLLCEKLAVDAMISDKTTYMRYNRADQRGESHVYTIGYIGRHKVISTKLPVVGRELGAHISSGNITTRLLGTFQSVEHVLLVGVAGGVPSIPDYERHSRLGDIVVSAGKQAHPIQGFDQAQPTSDTGSIVNHPFYVLCDKVNILEPNTTTTNNNNKESSQLPPEIEFTHKQYLASDRSLLASAERAVHKYYEEVKKHATEDQCAEWAGIIRETIDMFAAEPSDIKFSVPSPDSNKVTYHNMTCPQPDIPEMYQRMHRKDMPTVRFGCLGAGRPLANCETVRENFAERFQIIAFDEEFDQVLEALTGSSLQSYLFVRGVADYFEGRHGGQLWQTYAALAAASFMKSTILNLPMPPASDK